MNSQTALKPVEASSVVKPALPKALSQSRRACPAEEPALSLIPRNRGKGVEGTKGSKGQSSLVITHMSVHDVPAVMAIERTSFPRPWPERAYRYELLENPNAYFVVARAIENEAGVDQRSVWRKLARLLRLRPTPHFLLPTAHSLHATTKVVGFAGMWMYVDEAHIATIATHQNWRRRGIGELILLNLLREAQRRAASSVTLEVRASNTVAQNLYRKYGFEEVGYRKAYYHDNREDALLMTVTHFTEPGYGVRLDALERDRALEIRD